MDTVTQRQFRKTKEQAIKNLLKVINIFVEEQGFTIQNRIVFVDKKTGEVFK